MKIPVKPKRKLQTIDPDCESKFKEYIDKKIEEERKTYHSDLEPFEVRAQKVRKELEEYFHNFYQSFQNGYKVLMKEIKKHSS